MKWYGYILRREEYFIRRQDGDGDGDAGGKKERKIKAEEVG